MKVNIFECRLIDWRAQEDCPAIVDCDNEVLITGLIDAGRKIKNVTLCNSYKEKCPHAKKITIEVDDVE